ncbi:helix-turn-helix domain-containing protein [Burkholderia cepacia]|uniref:helix-turn-helix domain-containing protein n=1 Tax=Burkholderia cepacia TaxID=292 RepID=UPI002AB73977|nr:helix-turn-helix transcriptional regulator [Burkholderia cepacia]
MQKRTVRPGRPAGTTSYEAEPAAAFGMAVRAARMKKGLAQDEFAVLAGVDRSHMGKIERGTHMPTLAMILRIAGALDVSSADLMAATESILRASSKS